MLWYTIGHDETWYVMLNGNYYTKCNMKTRQYGIRYAHDSQHCVITVCDSEPITKICINKSYILVQLMTA